MNWARASRSTTLKKKTNSSLVDSTYNCKTQQNATLSSQERQGYVQLKASLLCFVIFEPLDYFSSWEFR